MKEVAEHVVIRHVCHCKAAVVRPSEGEAQEHVFTVDGEDFPWFIDERGQRVTQIADDMFTINVKIFGVAKAFSDEHPNGVFSRYLPLRLDGMMCHNLFIGDTEFPWDITESGVIIRSGAKIVPSVELSFFAKSVDSNQLICDARQVRENIDGALVVHV